MKEKIIIGIDPGTRVTGYGILKVKQNQFLPLDFGCIKPPAAKALSDRYEIIFSSLQQLIDTFAPTEMALETPFFHKQKNPQSSLKLGIAMGCALLAAKTKGIKVFGYSPREVKCSVVGTGKASKEQVQQTIMRFLTLKSAPEPQDAADALAIAICHITSASCLSFSKTSAKEL